MNIETVLIMLFFFCALRGYSQSVVFDGFDDLSSMILLGSDAYVAEYSEDKIFAKGIEGSQGIDVSALPSGMCFLRVACSQVRFLRE